jgi:hypothetical protein
MNESFDWDDVSKLVDAYGDGKWLAGRITEWRNEQKPPWSMADLAEHMTKAGNTMSRMAVWKIENPDKPSGRRYITVDEALAFARIFHKSIAEVLLPPEALQEVDGFNHFTAAMESMLTLRDAWSDYQFHVESVRARIAARPKLANRIEDYQRGALERYRQQLERVWLIDNDTASGVAFNRFMSEADPAPEIIPAVDVLSHEPLRGEHWYSDRTRKATKK